MYAIVKSGGKQYRVSEGTVITVEKLEAQPGDTVRLEEVLLVADNGDVQVGTPLVEGAAVTAEVIETVQGPKITGYTYKPTKKIRRHYGHRQQHTRLRVSAISA